MSNERSDEGPTAPLTGPHTRPDAHVPADHSGWRSTYFDQGAGPVPPSHQAASTYYSAPQPVSPRHGTARTIVATALLAGLIGGSVGAGGYALLDHGSSGSAPVIASAPAAATPAVDAKPGSVTYAAQVASRSTADIKVATSQGTAVGSGVILSPDGYVLTNNHVVAGAGDRSTIEVTTPDGKTYPATVKGTSPSYDIAVIKLDGASGLTPAVIGDSSTLQVGEQVVAVGSPENLSNTVTSGIVSALSRTVTAADEQGGSVTVYNGLQTDTPINPGNSGGPLVNLQGQVIAVNSAVDTGQAGSGGPQAFGLGFAIPINAAKRVANELLQNGQATKPVLGVSGSLESARGAAVNGARVTGVQRGGAAADAGIRAGDVITKVGDVPVSNYADLMAQILTHTPGQTVPVTVTRNGQTETMQVKLGGAADKQQTTIPEQSGSGDSGGSPLPFGGDGGGLVP
ncbi:S1C family serine protease [Gordonia sp. NPDC003425]